MSQYDAFLVAQKSGAKILLHISKRGTHIQYRVLPFNASGKQQQESWRLLLVLGYLADVNGRLTNSLPHDDHLQTFPENYPDISIQSFLLDGSIHSYTLWIPHYNLRRVPESNASKVQPLSSPTVAMIELALSWSQDWSCDNFNFGGFSSSVMSSTQLEQLQNKAVNLVRNELGRRSQVK